jgi:hypothetical protein
MILCDIEAGAGIAMLSNSTFPHRAENSDRINSVRREVADVIFGGLK